MKNRLLFLLLLILMSCAGAFSQKEQEIKVYHPEADAMADLEAAISQASVSGKHILIFIGGNWCPWCVLLDGWIKDHASVDSMIQADFVALKVNYSREVPNEKMMDRLEYPNRFGFPVIVVLNSKGQRIHTQNTAYLEEGKSYDEKKVLDFLKSWNVQALKPKKK